MHCDAGMHLASISGADRRACRGARGADDGPDGVAPPSSLMMPRDPTTGAPPRAHRRMRGLMGAAGSSTGSSRCGCGGSCCWWGRCSSWQFQGDLPSEFLLTELQLATCNSARLSHVRRSTTDDYAPRHPARMASRRQSDSGCMRWRVAASLPHRSCRPCRILHDAHRAHTSIQRRLAGPQQAGFGQARDLSRTAHSREGNASAAHADAWLRAPASCTVAASSGDRVSCCRSHQPQDMHGRAHLAVEHHNVNAQRCPRLW